MANVLAMDLGGTKLLGGIVSPSGEILNLKKVKVVHSEGPDGLLGQIADVAKELTSGTDVRNACLASAGPLDPIAGNLLNPTNMTSGGKHWGLVTVVPTLEKLTGLKWSLENDAAAAVVAEAWLGGGKECENVISITLGTGVGVGVWANGSLLRAGRHLHTEAGHLIIEHEKKEVLCGCGNYGCAEAYLSGKNFTRWVAEKWGESLNGEKLVALARSGDPRALAEFDAYGCRLAVFMRCLIVLFAPERIILSGGFSHASELFLPSALERLERLLESRRAGVDMLPQVFVSKFQDEMGVIGAAKIALTH